MLELVVTSEMKQCTKCNEIYPATEEYFYKRTAVTKEKGKIHRLSSWCKKCDSIRTKNYQNVNKIRRLVPKGFIYKEKRMSKEIYEHISNNLYRLEIDLENGLILNRKVSYKGKYPAIGLNYKTVFVHQIMVVAAYGEKCIGMTVNHENEIKTDNRIKNLTLMPISLNNELRSNNGGKNKKSVKSINLDTGEERIFESFKEASNELGVHVGSICNVLSGKCKRAGRYSFTEIHKDN
ncbi:HNH endonuclease [Bacillus xiapuensis]|uniref:HNH endonuclease n=1 Tax=Bacillus xiapuensis TaxID=2014075 RepID=A0ABU6N811_9BACI|nr:HNH endonuclease [Bacillus xiapuensis]